MKKIKKNNNTEKIYKDLVILDGIVLESFANATFDVKLENNDIVKCTISGKIRINKIRINPGDKVQIGASIYNLKQGRILYRY